MNMSKNGRRKRHEPRIHVNKYHEYSKAKIVAAQLAFEAEKQRRGLFDRGEQQPWEIESRLAEEQRLARSREPYFDGETSDEIY
jgi:hypothetical protein